jgi:pullulanase/glycogen debranching enzyme
VLLEHRDRARDDGEAHGRLVVTWATEYKVDGFRFDLMGHHSKANMLAVRAALDALTVERTASTARDLRLRRGLELRRGGERRPLRAGHAAQHGRHGHRHLQRPAPRRRARRRAVRREPARPGLRLGAAVRPQRRRGERGRGQQRAGPAARHGPDPRRDGRQPEDYTFVDRTGKTVKGSEVDYNGSPTGYTADPQENVLYVSAHDNETLFDSLAFKLPQGTSMADRVRMQQLSLSTVALGQGVSFFHAGTDMLRSKSLDRNSYDSGDHFNELDFSYATNNFGVGLPPAPDNETSGRTCGPLLADPALKPAGRTSWPRSSGSATCSRGRLVAAVLADHGRAGADQAAVPQHRRDQIPGLLVMHLDDTVGDGRRPGAERVVVLINATDAPQSYTAEQLAEAA